jgi:hypothetical protein
LLDFSYKGLLNVFNAGTEGPMLNEIRTINVAEVYLAIFYVCLDRDGNAMIDIVGKYTVDNLFT